MSSNPAPRILIVDDSESNRYTASRHLRRAGYEVFEAATGQEALKALENNPDLVILDVRLPDINGLELSRKLRQDPITRGIPILQVSATFTMSADRVRGLDAGADAYLVGPIEPEELLANVRMLLRLRAAQDDLARKNERLRSVLATIVDVFYSFDLEGRFLEINPAAEALFRRSASEMIGLNIQEVFSAFLDSDFAVYYRKALESRQPVHFESESVISPGTWWEGHAYPREDRVDVYLRDITSRKAAEQKLSEAAAQTRRQLLELQAIQAELAKARDQLRAHNEALEITVAERTAKLRETISDLEIFSYSITHDMRGPLRAMQGFSRLLLETHADKLEGEAADFLKRIANSAERLDLLIRDVLSYSNIIRSKLEPRYVDMDKLVRDIIHEYPGFQPPQAEIEVRDVLPPVLGNEAFLTQCISNLLSNAVKFVAPGVRPRVRLTGKVSEGVARLSVIDNGIGIPREHQARLFTLFHRAQTGYPGTGIGLAVVRKAAERMGGHVGLESAPGEGSTFWIELPAAKQ